MEKDEIQLKNRMWRSLIVIESFDSETMRIRIPSFIPDAHSIPRSKCPLDLDIRDFS